MNPIVKKKSWRLIVKVEILGSLFAQNTTLIIISHVIKIITKGFMHNNRLPQRVKMVWDRCPNPILPHWVKCRHYGFSSDDIGDLVTIWFRGSKSYMMVA